MSDPRHFQIAALASLLAWGVFALSFGVDPARATALIGTALATQFAWACVRGERFDARSPLISALSLCLLLRSDSLLLACALAVAAISSKFLIRYRGKHLFNPTVFGIVLGLLASDGVWVSAGQWGTAAWWLFAVACVGSVVVRRAERSDVTLAFLASYLGLVFARALWLGDPLALPLHSLQNGALLLFAFFMISDPRSTPDSRLGRCAFAFVVALAALGIQYGLYRPNGLLFALALSAPLVPLMDRWLPARRYEWRRREAPKEENRHERKDWPAAAGVGALDAVRH